MNDLIDIGIPCYNAPNTLKRTLYSVAMQTLASKCNVYILDDCSTNMNEIYEDILVEFKNSFNKLKILHTEKNSGPGSARNLLLTTEECDSEYIKFIDADDTLNNTFSLEVMYYTFLHNNMADAVIGLIMVNCCDTNKDSYSSHAINKLISTDHGLKSLHGYMYRRSALKKYDIKFPDNIISQEDIAFNTHLLMCVTKIININDTVYTYHNTPGSITHRADIRKFGSVVDLRNMVNTRTQIFNSYITHGGGFPYKDGLDLLIIDFISIYLAYTNAYLSGEEENTKTLIGIAKDFYKNILLKIVKLDPGRFVIRKCCTHSYIFRSNMHFGQKVSQVPETKLIKDFDKFVDLLL